jgi:hypothetical protein
LGEVGAFDVVGELSFDNVKGHEVRLNAVGPRDSPTNDCL